MSEKKKGKKKQSTEFVAPLHHLKIRTKLPLTSPSSHPTFPYFIRPMRIYIPQKPHTRATRVQIPDPFTGDIPQPGSAPSSSLRVSPAASAYRVGYKEAAEHCPSALPESCASSGMFRIPIMIARCRVLRMSGRDMPAPEARKGSVAWAASPRRVRESTERQY